jgi:hypothetical protein
MNWDQLVQRLDEDQVVAVVTRRVNGDPTVAPIWAVVVDGHPYIRSYLGPTARWYQQARSGRSVAFTTGDGAVAEQDKVAALGQDRIEVRTEYVTPADPIQSAIDAEFLAKYLKWSAEADEMVQPAVVACTLRVLPA